MSWHDMNWTRKHEFLLLAINVGQPEIRSMKIESQSVLGLAISPPNPKTKNKMKKLKSKSRRRNAQTAWLIVLNLFLFLFLLVVEWESIKDEEAEVEAMYFNNKGRWIMIWRLIDDALEMLLPLPLLPIPSVYVFLLSSFSMLL